MKNYKELTKNYLNSLSDLKAEEKRRSYKYRISNEEEAKYQQLHDIYLRAENEFSEIRDCFTIDLREFMQEGLIELNKLNKNLKINCHMSEYVLSYQDGVSQTIAKFLFSYKSKNGKRIPVFEKEIIKRPMYEAYELLNNKNITLKIDAIEENVFLNLKDDKEDKYYSILQNLLWKKIEENVVEKFGEIENE